MIKSKKDKKKERVEHANALLINFSSVGAKFFLHNGGASQFEVDTHGKIWFLDKCSDRRVYVYREGRWKGFTEGGTLRTLIEALRDYIRTGEKISPRFVVPAFYSYGDVYGYGVAAIKELMKLSNDNPVFEQRPLELTSYLEEQIKRYSNESA
ncbi:hypothetical protein [Vibrio sp. D431a]|uniref:hypothetical protein n=1 Tax=Vibrio sp. D431a TaxID=2837388 RepID=UPI002553757D|nr:hypothetical protein [Vibrio sp. D431a]MDK9789774.1 hypothetical protein [Vibrio sp. D431a]